MDASRWTLIGVMLIPLIPIAWGAVSIVNREWAWSIAQKWRVGAESPRPSRWELGVTLSGVVLILLGLGLGLFMWPRLLPLLQK